MKYQSFIMRVLCLLLIVGVVLGYNSMQKKDSDTEKDQQIASLTTRVEALEKQGRRGSEESESPDGRSGFRGCFRGREKR